MAYLYCSECGNQLIENAASCSHCQLLSKFTGRNGRAFTVVILLLLLSSTVYYFSMPGQPVKNPIHQTALKK